MVRLCIGRQLVVDNNNTVAYIQACVDGELDIHARLNKVIVVFIGFTILMYFALGAIALLTSRELEAQLVALDRSNAKIGREL